MINKQLTPKIWYNQTIGHSYDTDRAYGPQCWDYFDYFCQCCGLTALSRYCGITRFAGDIWKQRNTNGAGLYFEFINPRDIREGDWVFWDRHVAFYYQGREIGQNQNGQRRVTSMAMNYNGILGAFRYKYWLTSESGIADKWGKDYDSGYKTKAALNLRTGPGTSFPAITVIPRGGHVRCYGYYAVIQSVPWLYVEYYGDRRYVGFCSSKWLTKEE